nr:hypothetical protein [Pseudonocardia sp. ICBG601]
MAGVGRAGRGPVVVASLFVPYDYSFLPAGTSTPEEGLAAAHAAGVVCTDEYLLHPDPYATRAEWSAPGWPPPPPASTRSPRTCRPSW